MGDEQRAEGGAPLPKIIYGTAWKQERTANLTETAVLAGFRGIDTACQPKHYDEAGVGAALQRLKRRGIERSDLHLQTKFTPLSGHDPLRIPYDREAPVAVQVAQSIEVSKRNLQTEYVDALILHSPMPSHGQTMDAWRAMEMIYRSGAAKRLGISNCYELSSFKRIYTDADIKPSILQNRFYRNTGYDTALRRYCSERGVVYQSFWTLTANPHLLESERVHALASKYEKTPAQIVFRFLSGIGIVPLTGTCSELHMKEDLDSFGFELSIDESNSLHRMIDPS